MREVRIYSAGEERSGSFIGRVDVLREAIAIAEAEACGFFI